MSIILSLDGTINIHTIHKGHFVKTICFNNEKIYKFINLNVKLSNQRQILVYSFCLANSLTTLNDSSSQAQVVFLYFHCFLNYFKKIENSNSMNFSKKKNMYELFLYSINGKLISYEKLINPVQDMIIKDDYCILAVLINQTKVANQANNNKQNNYVSKIIFKENYE